jgi:hypothetical protein
MAQLPVAGIMLRHACVGLSRGLEHVHSALSAATLLWGDCLTEYLVFSLRKTIFR